MKPVAVSPGQERQLPPLTLADRARAAAPPLRRAILAWYRRNARDLPWRRTRDPYRVWLSEVMLQQTRVETVIPYYERFLEAFPTVERLAAAPEDRVLKLWEGLGYYRRARNLHAAAKRVVDRHAGTFPQRAQELERLPGIGRYSAGALASIAFGEPVPVLDGNVKRVLARVFALSECIDEHSVIRGLWSAAEVLVSPRAPGNFNQAMMELGARVCVPINPVCTECPLARLCEAFQQGIQRELPVRRKKKPVPHYEVVAAALERDGHYLLGKRPRDAMLGGLWELPGGKVEPGETHAEALTRELLAKLAISVEAGPLLTTVEHGYSHFTITLHVYRCRLEQGVPAPQAHDQLKWILPARFGRYAMPASTLKALRALRGSVR